MEAVEVSVGENGVVGVEIPARVGWLVLLLGRRAHEE